MTDDANDTPSTSAAPTAPLDAVPDDIFCQHCGYNLKMLTGERCPECGESIAGVRALNSQIPWVYRNQLGSTIASPLSKGGQRGVLMRTANFFALIASWWRAYWKTVWMVMFRRRRLAEEMARPVSYRDAQHFRFVTIAIVCSTAILASLSFMATHAQCPTYEPIVMFFWKNWWASAALHFFAALALLAATSVPSYFFHPHALSIKQQNRAVALSYYTCAPLVFLPLAICIAVVPILFPVEPLLIGIWLLASSIIIFTIFAFWWVQLIFLARRTMPQRRRRAVLIGLLIPPIWCLIGLTILAVPFAVGFYLYIIFSSFA